MTKPCALTLAFAAFLIACNDEGDAGEKTETDGTQTTVDTLVRGIAEEQILADVDSFRAGTAQLVRRAEDFCDSLDDETLSVAREQWQHVAGDWYRVQLFNFGPADADPVFPLFTFIDSLRLRGDDYSSSVTGTLERWRESGDVLDDEFFAAQRFDDVGLLAVELALFESEDPLVDYSDEPRNCDILTGLAQALADRARQLHDGWVEEYDGTGTPFVELLIDDELPNGREPLVQIVISAQEYLDYLHSRGVVALAGKTSDTGWYLVEQALDAVDQLLSSDQGGRSVYFWMELLGDPAAVEKVEQDLLDARTALEAQDTEALEAALVALDGDFKREVPDSLGIELGLTFTDGD